MKKLLILVFSLAMMAGYSQECGIRFILFNDDSIVVALPFLQYALEDTGNRAKIFVEYPPTFNTKKTGFINWERQIRVKDSIGYIKDKTGNNLVDFHISGTKYLINKDWIESIEPIDGGTHALIAGRYRGRKFVSDEDYLYIISQLFECPWDKGGPGDDFLRRVFAENGLHMLNDSTVHLGGNLIENTDIIADGYNFLINEPTTTARFGLGYTGGIFGDTVFYFYRPWGSGLNSNRFYIGRNINSMIINRDNGSSLRATWENRTNSGSPQFSILAEKGTRQSLFSTSSQGAGWSIFDTVSEMYASFSGGMTGMTMYLGENSDNKVVQVGVLRDVLNRKFPIIQDQKCADSTAKKGQVLELVEPLTGEVKYVDHVLDTFVLNEDFDISDSLILECQELYLTAEANISSPGFVTISFPDAQPNYRGKKIIVNVTDDSGTYAVVLDSPSTLLWFTDNTATTLPTAQGTIITDTSPWKSKGTSYEFTCARHTDGVYYWKLTQ